MASPDGLYGEVIGDSVAVCTTSNSSDRLVGKQESSALRGCEIRYSGGIFSRGGAKRLSWACPESEWQSGPYIAGSRSGGCSEFAVKPALFRRGLGDF